MDRKTAGPVSGANGYSIVNSLVNGITTLVSFPLDISQVVESLHKQQGDRISKLTLSQRYELYRKLAEKGIVYALSKGKKDRELAGKYKAISQYIRQNFIVLDGYANEAEIEY